MLINDYRRLTGAGVRIADLLHAPEAAEMGLDPPRLPDLAQEADLS